MLSLSDLRSKISDTQVKALSAIWEYRVSTGRWIPLRVLHKLFGGKSAVRPILEELGGTVVLEVNDTQNPKYSLRLIGILLTEGGEVLEKRLLDYLRLAYELAIDEPLRTHVHSTEVGQSLKLGPLELAELGILLMISPFTSGGSYSQDEWNAGLPKDIEDLPDALSDYVRQIVMSSYDPFSPTAYSERQNYSHQKRQEKQVSVFWFVHNDRLRSSLESDWNEVQNIYKQQAWKAIVVLSGGIIEGVLLDTLGSIEDDARAAYFRLRSKTTKKPIQKWGFFDLIDVSSELGIIRGASPYFGHAIRELRNLIHPARGLVLDRIVTQRDADLAFKSAEALIQDIADSKTRSA